MNDNVINFCKDCGNKLTESDKFCSRCGTAILPASAPIRTSSPSQNELSYDSNLIFVDTEGPKVIATQNSIGGKVLEGRLMLIGGNLIVKGIFRKHPLSSLSELYSVQLYKNSQVHLRFNNDRYWILSKIRTSDELQRFLENIRNQLPHNRQFRIESIEAKAPTSKNTTGLLIAAAASLALTGWCIHSNMDSGALSDSEFFPIETVKHKVVTKEHLGGQIQVFLIWRPQQGYLGIAKSCVAHYLKEYKSAYCYVFATEAAYNSSKIDLKTGGMQNVCYRATFGQAIAGNTTQYVPNEEWQQMEASGCSSPF